MGERSEHISFFFVPVIGLLLAFVVTWGLGAVTLFGAFLAYGLFGMEVGPLPARTFAFTFSLIFVVVTLIGWASWAYDKLTSPTPGAQQHD